jgi:hypothetical protein
MENKPTTIEDVIRMTANDLGEICALPVQMHEEVRLRLAMIRQGLRKCLEAIERDRKAQEARAAEQAPAEAPAEEQEEDAPFEPGEDEEQAVPAPFVPGEDEE